MSAPLKVIIIFVLWLLYTLFLLRSCSDTLCLGCMPGAVEEAVTEVTRYPIDFQWENPTAYTNEGYETLRQSILDGKTENSLLEITGFYFEAEPQPEGFENMGFARADRVRQLFMPDVPAERIQLKARLIDEREGVREVYFEGVAFDWLEPEETVAETIEELEDRINIRFPYNSTAGEYTPEVLEYIKKLSDLVKDSGQRIRLTGHTDNVGTPEFNMDLGQRRAEAIKQALVSNGVDPAQIITESRGKTQPIATNETEEGRHENRRVEVRLLPQ